MAIVKPFKAYRPKDNADKIACPPYDVLNSAEAAKMAEGNPLSFLHVDKAEIDLPADIDLYDDRVYAKAKENLDNFIADGVLKQEQKPCYYVYAQTMDGRTQYGIVAATSCEEYDKGIIRRHELTRKDKEEDRTRHIETLQATTGPVFLAYPDDKYIDFVVAKTAAKNPEYDFTADDGIRHRVWIMYEEEDIKVVQNAFAKKPVLYIADGHHRSAAASACARKRRAADTLAPASSSYNFFLSVIFPASQLYIMAYNRLVKDLNGKTPAQFLAALQNVFTVEKTDLKVPPALHQVCMYMGRQWYLLTAKPSAFDAADPVAALDVSILQENVLSPLLGIQDPRTDKRISFVGGIRGTGELEDKVNGGKYAVAFSMFPTSIEELFKVADAKLIMPPKSTWFEPKLRSGLLVYKY
jgi:uncharacterized protein (DUF1015 family)